MKKTITSLVFIFLCICINSVSGNTLSTSEDALFQQGIENFKNGNYVKAISIFEKLNSKNRASDNIRYNLAVAYFKNKQYQKSKILFTALSQSPSYTAVAYLNLGLISVKNNQLNEAKDYFLKAIKTDKNKNITLLAKKMLGRISTEDKPKLRTKWLTLASISTGLEDRTVNLINETTTTSKNHFMDLSFYAGKDIFKNKIQRLNYSANAFLTLNKENQDFNFLFISNSLRKTVRHKQWYLSPSINIDYMRLGDKNFQAALGGILKIKRKLLNKHNAIFQYKTSYIEGLHKDFSSFNGTQHKFRFQTQLYFSATKIDTYYEYEKNYRSQSYTLPLQRNKLKLSIETKIANQLKPKLTAEYRLTNFNLLAPVDRYLVMKAQVAYAISNRLDITAEYERLENDRYSYVRNKYTLGLQYLAW